MKRLIEEINEFGIPGLEEARVNWKGLCQKLLAAAEMHLMIMAGEAEDEEDPLAATVEEVKAEMEPQEEPEVEGPETEEESENAKESMQEAAARIADQAAAIECIEYILDHESRDYFEWCDSEGFDCSDVNNPHIYAVARKAMGDKEIKESIIEAETVEESKKKTSQAVEEATKTWLPHALTKEQRKLVGEVSNKLGYAIDSACAFSVALLEDVNAHKEAAQVNAILLSQEEGKDN